MWWVAGGGWRVAGGGWWVVGGGWWVMMIASPLSSQIARRATIRVSRMPLSPHDGLWGVVVAVAVVAVVEVVEVVVIVVVMLVERAVTIFTAGMVLEHTRIAMCSRKRKP